MKKIFLILMSLSLTFVGCQKDFGDMNVNENGVSSVVPSALITAGISRYSSLAGREYLNKAALYSQYVAQITYTDEMLYNEAPSTWYGYYVQTLSNFQLAYDDAMLDDNKNDGYASKFGANENIAGVAMIMKAIIFKRITDSFGDIPFAEALYKDGNVNPAYSKQEDVYKGIITMLKDGRDMIDVAKKGVVGDPLFDGDMAAWQKLANSFLMSASLQLSKKYPGASDYAATEFKAAYGDGAGYVSTVGDEAWFYFNADQGLQNPWSANRTADYALTKELMDALKGDVSATSRNRTSNHTADPRAEWVAADPTGEGIPYGYDGSDANVGMSSYLWAPSASLPFMTSSYTTFNIAHAVELGWVTGNSADLLEQGILLSFSSINAHSDLTLDGTAYAAARKADAGTVAGGAAQVISEEKWVALFPDGHTAWAEWRRTDFPKLLPGITTRNDGNIPRRLNYPAEEAGLNPDGYAAGVGALVPATDNNTSKVWWDQ